MATLDRLSPLLERFRVRTRLFHTGPLCGVTTFDARPGRGFLHVLRHGAMDMTHRGADGRPRTRRIDEPTLLFYPRPLEHSFHNAPTADSDFACATIDFDGGATHPLVRTLPAVVTVPLAAVDTLAPALALLFAEIDTVRCGRDVLVDRLFEVVLIQLFRWILDHADQLALPHGLLTGLADERLARTLVALHEQPGRAWTLTTMAQEARMSRSSFAAHFKQVVGQPPADYLTGWRMTLAQARLRAGASVAHTAAELGYANPPAFSRAFTQKIGHSPRAWIATAHRDDTEDSLGFPDPTT
ncbi:helix-turn-helix transcriptional regulator [Nocardia bovistercoris]|uniref:AraC family transcriptional regulator n=1 Tax=Nocardia bovistercoris TaxID=2785916 RepID=A0A931IC26_9NOCA|nr:AraC family transcriptional regulator [Nocardia bovistercoris]MBH0777763.1 AraC family transcriptional regulator [Nocardia bovistercoris]